MPRTDPTPGLRPESQIMHRTTNARPSSTRMSDLVQLVVFRLDEHRYALSLDAVKRIVRAVAVTPLPNASPIVLGTIDVEGELLPVLDIRRRLGLQARPLRPSDQFLIATTARRTVVVVVDAAEDVFHVSESAVVDPAGIVPGIESLRGVAQLGDGLVLINDLDRFLSLSEEEALDVALSHRVDVDQAESC
jgi:purine-binding chemotaxis protein CheW